MPGTIPGPHTCEACALPLSYIPKLHCHWGLSREKGPSAKALQRLRSAGKLQPLPIPQMPRSHLGITSDVPPTYPPLQEFTCILVVVESCKPLPQKCIPTAVTATALFD